MSKIKNDISIKFRKFKKVDDIPEFPSNLTSSDAEEFARKYIEAGAIAKEDLISGGWYTGQSRNTNIAQWFPNPGRFYFIRYKMDGKYVDNIHHFQDDNGYDLFIPFKLIKI